MVATPWGESDSLRERRLRPGPGRARGEVERNQRERLFGAMVALVAERGYDATTVASLTDLSGVSSRTFYGLFADKAACFRAALEAMIEAAIGYAAAASETKGKKRRESWEERARAGSSTFAKMIAAQPAAARMCLIEVYAAGAEVLAPLEHAVAGFEQLARQMLAQSPERAEMPGEMVSAYIGAIQEVVRMRLLAGREAELPGLMDELWDLIGAYRPPPRPLRLATRPPAARATEALEAHDHAERALRAFAVVVAEKGYAAATVDDVVKRAGMSATTFYANFRGKEDALMAAIDSAGAQIRAAIGPAIRRAPDQPHGVRAGFGALFNFLASRPALARLVAVEVYAAGPRAMERRVELLRPLEALLTEAQLSSSQTRETTVELIAGMVYSLAYRRIRESGPQSLPGLAPLCSYLALTPSLGAEKASAVANERGG